MEYQEAMEWVFGLETMGIKLGLSNITELLARLGDPQKQFRSIHVAGTNGKGSVSAMTASILRAQGYRTALYTSPHLVDYRERIQVDGEPISRKRICHLAREVKGHVEDMCLASAGTCPTFFEVTTALAFLHFAEVGVEAAVVEVGMGGRLDATNVILPECSVITRIGLEHTQYLGETLRMIAAEKAGIIKPGVPVISAEEDPEAFEVVYTRAKEAGAPLRLVREGVDFHVLSSTLDGTEVRFPKRGINVKMPLLGAHQASNAAMSMAVAEAISSRGLPVRDEAITIGLSTVKWPGRLEIVRRGPNLILDATHTPQGASIVAKDLRRLVQGRIILVIGVLNDKDLDGVVGPFADIAEWAIATAPMTERAFPKEKVREALTRHLQNVGEASSVVDAVQMALKEAGREDTVLVTGSIYTIGEAKAWWDANEGP